MSRNKVQRKRANAGLILWTFLVILVLAGAAVAVTASGSSAAAAWRMAATHQPETYSELYFDSPAHLPGYAPAGKPQTIAFHITNHEHAARSYQYETSVTIHGVTSVHTYRVRLADGQAAAETLSFTIPGPNETASFTITLLGTHQRLTFRSAS